MDEINIMLYRISLALYAVGTLLYCVGRGTFDPFRFLLFLSSVLALAVVLAPIGWMQTSFYVFLVALALIIGTFSIAAGLEDVSRVTFSGLLCYLVAVAVELWRFRLLTISRP